MVVLKQAVSHCLTEGCHTDGKGACCKSKPCLFPEQDWLYTTRRVRRACVFLRTALPNFLVCKHQLPVLSLAGLTEMAAFGLAVVFDLAVAKVLPTAGWPGVLKMLLLCAIGGTVVMAIFMQQEKHYEENLANL